MEKCFIDFEFNKSNEKMQNLVCACYSYTMGKEIEYESIWLHNDKEAYQYLKESLIALRDTHIFLAFNVEAEARSFISLGLDPMKFKWVDLQKEYAMLLNGCNKYAYGDQLIKGKFKHTKPPKNKYKMTQEEKDEADGSKAEKSLVACTYKLLGVDLNLEHKNKMRDLILTCPESFSDNDKQAILEYCASDIKHLPSILKTIANIYTKEFKKSKITFDEMLYRGQNGAITALMISRGYPVDTKAVKNIFNNSQKIIDATIEDLNRQFTGLFEYNKKTNKYVLKQKYIRDWIEKCPFAKTWTKTKGGQLSTKKDSFEKFYTFNHDYPQGNFPAQILRFSNLKSSLAGFIPNEKKESILSSLGSDDRIRPWLNPYGGQTSRFQPKATSFIPLKSAWMRVMIEPKKGKIICGMDYSSQEFLLSAILSQDKTMYEAYTSGDPYLYFAKKAGAVPKNGKKEDYKKERNLFKSTTLGLSYGMGSKSLSNKLSMDMGEKVSEIKAQKLVESFQDTYPDYMQWTYDTYNQYQDQKFLKLLDGWVLFGDNDSEKSVKNFPVQGMGAVILRKALELCHYKKLSVIFPLHDAIYIELDHDDLGKIDELKSCMVDALTFYFEGKQKEWASSIRVDADVWGPDIKLKQVETPNGIKCKSSKIYIDERGVKEYEFFKKYL